jgi:hypothetical protein
MKKLFEIVKVFDVEPFAAGEGDWFRFRLEVIRELDSETYTGKVYRQEIYRLQPSFPQLEGEPPDWRNDAQVLVVDEMFDPELLGGSSVQDVVAKFQTALTKIFG